jgi:hypothetical protein
LTMCCHQSRTRFSSSSAQYSTLCKGACSYGVVLIIKRCPLGFEPMKTAPNAVPDRCHLCRRVRSVWEGRPASCKEDYAHFTFRGSAPRSQYDGARAIRARWFRSECERHRSCRSCPDRRQDSSWRRFCHPRAGHSIQATQTVPPRSGGPSIRTFQPLRDLGSRPKFFRRQVPGRIGSTRFSLLGEKTRLTI